MNLDEFAFLNQQLGGMLQSGIPLEGALGQLSADMRKGRLRDELRALEQDLANGTPLSQALSKRRLPRFYIQMLKMGVAGNNLPRVLNIVADYYHKANSLRSRLKTILIYPGIVLVVSLALSIALALMYGYVLEESAEALGQSGLRPGEVSPSFRLITLWYPVVLIGTVFMLFVAVWIFGGFRHWLRWHLPGFKDATISQTASGIALMIENGSTFSHSLELAREIEADSPAQKELTAWQTRLAEGHKQFRDLAVGGKLFPPLFIWLVSGSGEDWVSGFKHAAEVYYARAVYKVELMLYAVLPIAILSLGILIVTQVIPMVRIFFGAMQFLGGE